MKTGQHRQHGIIDDRAVTASELARSTDSTFASFLRSTKEQQTTLFVLALCVVMGIIFPASCYFSFLIAGIFYFRAMRAPLILPLSPPVYSGEKDYSSPVTGTFRKQFKEAAGVGLLGYDLETQEQIWLTLDRYLTHILVFGETGAGKTETMLGHAFFFMLVGGGVNYNDAKGTVKLPWQLYSITRYFGMDLNFRVINLLTGNKSESRDPAKRRSNTFNAYATGSADYLSQYTISQMASDGGGGGDNKVFEMQAQGLVAAVMFPLTELRDQNVSQLNPGVLRKHLELPNVLKLAEHPLVSDFAKEEIGSFAASLAAYDASLPLSRQNPEVGRQFGFAQAYFTRSLSMLTGTYGHIFLATDPEIDSRDMVFNKRIVVTLLPTMEKSSGELGQLAKGILESIKSAIAFGLGDELEGHRSDTIDNGLASGLVPYGIISDEHAYANAKGFAVTTAMARGLKFSIIIGTQDADGLKRVDPDGAEAAQIFENTGLKQFHTGQATGGTMKLIQELAGKVEYVRMAGHERSKSGLQDLKEVPRTEVRETERISTLDLKGLSQGECYNIFKDRIIKSQVFYHGFADKDLVNDFEVVRLLKVDKPTRGAHAPLFYPGMTNVVTNVSRWVRNTTPEDVATYTSQVKQPKSINGLFASVYKDHADADPLSKALSFVSNFEVSGRVPGGGKLPPLPDPNEASEQEGGLSNAAGNAFNADGRDDYAHYSEYEGEESHQEQVDAELTPEKPLSDSVHPYVESSDASEDFPENKLDQMAAKIAQDANRIAQATKSAEIAGGASEDLANARAQTAANVVARARLHPTPPAPKVDDANKSIQDAYLEEWLAGDE